MHFYYVAPRWRALRGRHVPTVTLCTSDRMAHSRSGRLQRVTVRRQLDLGGWIPVGKNELIYTKLNWHTFRALVVPISARGPLLKLRCTHIVLHTHTIIHVMGERKKKHINRVIPSQSGRKMGPSPVLYSLPCEVPPLLSPRRRKSEPFVNANPGASTK